MVRRSTRRGGRGSFVSVRSHPAFSGIGTASGRRNVPPRPLLRSRCAPRARFRPGMFAKRRLINEQSGFLRRCEEEPPRVPQPSPPPSLSLSRDSFVSEFLSSSFTSHCCQSPPPSKSVLFWSRDCAPFLPVSSANTASAPLTSSFVRGHRGGMISIGRCPRKGYSSPTIPHSLLLSGRQWLRMTPDSSSYPLTEPAELFLSPGALFSRAPFLCFVSLAFMRVWRYKPWNSELAGGACRVVPRAG